MKKNEFMKVFEEAEKYDHLFIGVSTEFPNLNKPEITINSYSNFEAKKKYYQNEYDDNMCLKKNPEIKVVRAMSGDFVQEIVFSLFEGEDNYEI